MDTFNVEQGRQLTRFKTAENFFGKNENKFAILKPFQKQVTLLSANNKKINSFAPARSANGEAATEDKNDLKTTIAISVNSICCLVIPYALEVKNTELYNAVNFTKSDVTNMRDASVLAFVTTVVDAVTPLLSREDFAEYQVTAEQLDTLTSDAVTYDESLGDNKLIDSVSTVASANIDALLADNRIIIDKLNKLINFFADKDPDFVAGYHTAVAVNNTGIHHSGIRCTIINSTTKQPVSTATVILTGKKKTKTAVFTNDNVYEIISFRSGKAKLTIAAPDFQSQAMDVTIIRGKTLELNITLQAAAMNMASA